MIQVQKQILNGLCPTDLKYGISLNDRRLSIFEAAQRHFTNRYIKLFGGKYDLSLISIAVLFRFLSVYRTFHLQSQHRSSWPHVELVMCILSYLILWPDWPMKSYSTFNVNGHQCQFLRHFERISWSIILNCSVAISIFLSHQTKFEFLSLYLTAHPQSQNLSWRTTVPFWASINYVL
jgi:hypothetical protein